METVKDSTVEEQSFWILRGKEDYVNNWFLMNNPILIALIWTSYILFVYKLGPQLMKNRPGFPLRHALLVYNAAQVALSAYMVVVGSLLIFRFGLIQSACAELNQKDTRKLIAESIYIYLIAKVSELTDTIFFVLRKKQSQVTFLHVYHHSLMMWCTWLSLKFEPSYSNIFLGSINSFVHVIMYTYYGLSAFPSLTKYLWWKRYITTLQLVQFMIIITQAIASAYISECRPSYTLLYAICLNAVLFIYLFGDFYVNNYLKNKKTSEDAKKLIAEAKKAKKTMTVDEVVKNGSLTSELINGKTANGTMLLHKHKLIEKTL